MQGNGNHVIDADRLKLNIYFDIHKRADDLARVQMAITNQTELVQAVYETGKPVPKEDRETFRKENNFMNIAFWKSGKIRSFEVDKDAVKKATLTSGFFASKTLGRRPPESVHGGSDDLAVILSQESNLCFVRLRRFCEGCLF